MEPPVDTAAFHYDYNTIIIIIVFVIDASVHAAPAGGLRGAARGHGRGLGAGGVCHRERQLLLLQRHARGVIGFICTLCNIYYLRQLLLVSCSGFCKMNLILYNTTVCRQGQQLQCLAQGTTHFVRIFAAFRHLRLGGSQLCGNIKKSGIQESVHSKPRSAHPLRASASESSF